MDDLQGFLDGPRARDAFALRVVMAAPWNVAVRDEAALSVVVVTAGAAYVSAGSATARLRAGDAALLRGPDPYTMADRPGRETDVVVLPGQACVSPSGEPLTAQMTLGPGSWGNCRDGETVMLVGTYQSAGAVGRRLVDALPRLAVLPAGDLDERLVGVLAGELGGEQPGRQVVLDRLLDLVVVSAARSWFAGQEAGTRPPWFAAEDDPVVRRSLELLHERPEAPWTVATLARAVGLSRAALARRFQQATGTGPIAYLTAWRLALAADLLCEPDARVGRVAQRVGYGSPFTFSAAFKRHHGVSPTQYAGRAHAPVTAARS